MKKKRTAVTETPAPKLYTDPVTGIRFRLLGVDGTRALVEMEIDDDVWRRGHVMSSVLASCTRARRGVT